MLHFSMQAIRLLSSSAGNSVLVPFEAFAIPQVVTAAISSIASSAMAFMISNTEKGLTTPYRRIIFGLCMSDIVQSMALLTAPFFVPRDLPGSWGAGNEGTCRTTGFLLTFGMSAVPMYTCFLCFYYLCKLKHRMTNDTFRHKYEWKIHIFIFVINCIAACAGLAMDLYHPVFSRSYCSVAAVPSGCRMKPEIVGECDPIIKARGSIFILLDSIILNMLCLFGIIGMMIMLLFHVLSMSRMSMVNDNTVDVPPAQEVEEGEDHQSSLSPTSAVEEHKSDHSREGHDENQINNDEMLSLLAQENARRLSILYRKETFLQAKCYVGAFCLSYVPAFVLWGTIIAGRIPPKWMQVLPFLFYPLGGLFNILVYTRPQAANLQRQLPQRSRLQCLWLVLKAGGEMPKIEVEETNVEDGVSHNDNNNNNMPSLHDVDDPSFSFPTDFASIATPSYAVCTSNLSIGPSMRSKSQNNHGDDDANYTLPHNTEGTPRTFYRWPISSKEAGDSIWRSVSVGVRSKSNRGRRLCDSAPGSVSGLEMGQSGLESTHNSANQSIGTVGNKNILCDSSVGVVRGD